MTPQDQLKAYTQQVSKTLVAANRAFIAANRSHGGTQKLPTRTLFPLPMPPTDLTIDGLSVKGVLAPRAEDGAMQHLDDIICSLSLELTGGHLDPTREQLGKDATKYVTSCETFEKKIARLIWVLGDPIEVNEKDLIVDAGGTPFGVKGGKFVGGPYHATDMDIDTSDFLLKERNEVTTSVQKILARHLILKGGGRRKEETYDMLRVLCARAEWDKSIRLATLLRSKPVSAKHYDKLTQIVLESKDPYYWLYHALVPDLTSYTDFRRHFGNPENRGNIRTKRRKDLLEKLNNFPLCKEED